MKNIVISIVIFLLLILTVNFSIHSLNKSCKYFEENDIKLEELVEGEKWEESYKLSIQFLEEWKKNSNKIGLFINHTEIDNINNELWKLTQYVKCKDKEESLASIHAIKFFMLHIKDMEKINIQNIF